MGTCTKWTCMPVHLSSWDRWCFSNYCCWLWLWSLCSTAAPFLLCSLLLFPTLCSTVSPFLLCYFFVLFSKRTSAILYSFNNDLSLDRLVTQVADDTELVLPWIELADKWSEIMPHSGSCMFCNSYNMYILFALGNY